MQRCHGRHHGQRLMPHTRTSNESTLQDQATVPRRTALVETVTVLKILTEKRQETQETTANIKDTSSNSQLALTTGEQEKRLVQDGMMNETHPCQCKHAQCCCYEKWWSTCLITQTAKLTNREQNATNDTLMNVAAWMVSAVFPNSERQLVCGGGARIDVPHRKRSG